MRAKGMAYFFPFQLIGEFGELRSLATWMNMWVLCTVGLVAERIFIAFQLQAAPKSLSEMKALRCNAM